MDDQKPINEREPVPARISKSAGGDEARCGRGHLLGVFDHDGRLIIKCRCHELVSVEVPAK